MVKRLGADDDLRCARSDVQRRNDVPQIDGNFRETRAAVRSTSLRTLAHNRARQRGLTLDLRTHLRSPAQTPT
jgi:hypothetical protein